MSDHNRGIIEEFRTNGGKVGGWFEGWAMLILTSTGAKSGRPRESPLAYSKDGDRWIIVGSKGGRPTHPDWYFNLKANPEATIEVGTERIPVTATEATGAERDRLFAKAAADRPQFLEYQQKTERILPVFVLERREG
jgi:deazaflavin-dependent oxidoreductase (nitroreductase family)